MKNNGSNSAFAIKVVLPALLSSFFLLMVSCQKESVNNNIKVNDSLSVSFGTSYGECYGYCRHEVELIDTIANITISGWDKKSFPTKHYTKSITAEKWNKVVVEVSKINFSKLDTIYGCPDCCDGGAGWIIVKTKEVQYKVMLDLLIEAPSEIKPLWKLLGEINADIKINN